jgi:hypothetical protein
VGYRVELTRVDHGKVIGTGRSKPKAVADALKAMEADEGFQDDTIQTLVKSGLNDIVPQMNRKANMTRIHWNDSFKRVTVSLIRTEGH